MSRRQLSNPLTLLTICLLAIMSVCVIAWVAFQAPASVQTSFIQSVATLFAAGLAAAVVMWQVNANATAALRAKRIEKRRDVCVAVYEQIVAARIIARDPFTDLLALTEGVLQQIDSTWKFPDVSRANPNRLKYTSQSVLDIFLSSSHGVRSFHEIVENYQIALPGSDVFKIAFSVVGQELRAAWAPFYAAVVPFIPNELIAEARVEALLKRDAPQQIELKAIFEKGTRLQELSWDLVSFVEDFMTEAQGTLLSTTFRAKPVRRKPTDPNCVVLTTDVTDRFLIERHFAARREAIK